MDDKYQKLSLYIKEMDMRRRLILFKGEDELSYIKKWISSQSKDSDGQEDNFEEMSVQEIIQKCNRCNGIITRSVGRGSGKNSVMIILNAPSMISAIEKKSQESQSIELLRKMMEAIKVELDDCYTTYLLKCETGDPLCKPSHMFKNCEEILKKEIFSFKPGIILVMGDAVPLMNIINDNKNIFWKNIEHPVILIKNPERKKEAWEILKQVRAKLKESDF